MWLNRATSVKVRHHATRRVKTIHRLLSAIGILISMLTAAPLSALAAASSADEDAFLKRARAIHEKVIVLDTHIDFAPEHLVGERNYTQRLDTQFNLPNMVDGGLDALFFSIYAAKREKRKIRTH